MCHSLTFKCIELFGNWKTKKYYKQTDLQFHVQWVPKKQKKKERKTHHHHPPPINTNKSPSPISKSSNLHSLSNGCRNHRHRRRILCPSNPHFTLHHHFRLPHRFGLQLNSRPFLLQIGPPEPNRKCVLVRTVVIQKVTVVLTEVPPASGEAPPVPIVADGAGGEGVGGLPAAGGTEHRLLEDVVPDGEHDEQSIDGDEGGRCAESAECDIDESTDLFGRN